MFNEIISSHTPSFDILVATFRKISHTALLSWPWPPILYMVLYQLPAEDICFVRYWNIHPLFKKNNFRPQLTMMCWCVPSVRRKVSMEYACKTSKGRKVGSTRRETDWKEISSPLTRREKSLLNKHIRFASSRLRLIIWQKYEKKRNGITYSVVKKICYMNINFIYFV